MNIGAHTFDNRTGYGRWARSVAAALELLGYRIKLVSNAPLPEDLQPLRGEGKLDVIIAPPFTNVPAPIHFMTYESSRLSVNMYNLLRRREKVIVLCNQNKEMCEASGIEAHVCHPVVYPRYITLPAIKPFTFIHVSADAAVPARKRSADVVKAFLWAFPTEADVRLIIKKEPQDQRIPCFDTRVTLIYEMLHTVTPLLLDAHVGVFPSGQEGWGYVQSDLMGFGRPVIVPIYGGLADYCNGVNAYGLSYSMRKVPEVTYRGIGKCAYPEISEIARQMRWCYENPDDVVLKGVHAYRSMTRFTLQNMARRISEILK